MQMKLAALKLRRLVRGVFPHLCKTGVIAVCSLCIAPINTICCSLECKGGAVEHITADCYDCVGVPPAAELCRQ